MTKKMAAPSKDLKLCQTVFFLMVASVSVKGGIALNLNVQEAVCGANSDYFNTDTLVKPRSWILNYTQTPPKCLVGQADGTGCKFTLAFCHAVNCSETEPGLMNATACTSTLAKGNQTVAYKLGSYNPNENPFKEDPKGKGLSFLVQFNNGSVYNTSEGKSCNLSMELQFNCNEKSVWAVAAGAKPSNISSTVLTNLTYDAKNCKYLMAFNYSGACRTINPFPPADITTPLSFGSVLLIIFFVVLSVYCVFGSMCKFAAGSRGKEALPHSEFWVELPAYIADGFMFVCSCCKPQPDQSRSYDSI